MDWIRIIEVLVLSAAGILVAINSRKQPKKDEATAKAELERAENENYTAQFGASKAIVESTQELIGISQQLIKSVEEHYTILQGKYDGLKIEFDILQLGSMETKKSIDRLKDDYHRVLCISGKLLRGIKLLLTQMRTIDIKPVWEPPQDVLDTIDRRTKILDSEEQKK
jgi:hypothetical protein